MRGDEDDQVKQQLHQGMTTHEGGEEVWLGGKLVEVVFRKTVIANVLTT